MVQHATARPRRRPHSLILYCIINIGKVTVKISITYRPPPKQNGFRNSIFFDEWSKYLDNIAIIPYDVIITGDLNLRVDIKYNVEALTFFSILNSHGLTQHFNSATHKGGHTLDLVISRELSPIIVGTPSVFDPCLSSNRGKSFGDHLAVQFIINMDKSGCI